MRIGAIFPQTEIGDDVGAVRAWAETVESLGYAHVLAYDHVVGADPAVHEGWRGPYDVDSTFHEPFVLFGFLAGITSLELVTGIIILPQRQTVLVAKQAAQVDILTRGRFRLGVGLGWNAVEYEALGARFDDRGRRITEQVELMRALWCDRTVTHHGTHEHVTGAGLAPLPVQRPIPVWFGAASPPALARAGRIADGWFPMVSGQRLDDAIGIVTSAARDAGRDPATIGMEGRFALRPDHDDDPAEIAASWRARGATHLTVNTMNAGLRTVDDHLESLRAIASALGLGQ